MSSTRACILLAIWTVATAPAAAQDARLVTAAARQDRAEALALIAGGADVNEARADGATALIWAAHSGRVFNYGPAYTSSSTEVLCALLAAGADPHLTTDDGTTPLMAAAGLGRATYTPRVPRGTRSPMAEEAVRILLEAGADINAVNEADFTALHGAAFRGLNEVVEQLVAKGADIDARDFRGRTAYRMAEGSKQSFQFQSWPETAALLAELGADTRLGIPGTVQERLRDVALTVATGEP